MGEIEIRLCLSWDDCIQCEELQKQVWEMPDYRDAVPANLLITAIKNGGILVGAFRRTEMIGFAFGFLGSEKENKALSQTRNEAQIEKVVNGNARLKHTSHMLAVLPDARVHGLGARMKWLQRRVALEQGLDLMTWTYDPLQAINGYLNLARLGAVARRYYRNAYGEMTDALNAGMASDRFEVEWYLASARVNERETGSNRVLTPKAQSIYVVEWNDKNLLMIQDEMAFTSPVISIEIPSDIGALKAENLELGIQWRERTRDTFERAFADGYVATDVRRNTDDSNRTRVSYILQKGYIPTV